MPFKVLRTKSVTAALVGIITFIVFLPALQNEFINWDDDLYVYENPFIRSIDARLFKTAFLDFHVSNWHPLTWISHAIDYAIWGLNPLGHHLTNNILHAINAFVVVYLVIRLLGRGRNKTATNNKLSEPFPNDRAILITGAVTGLLFGLHPLHVESVAWVAERKDLLCALFFLLSVTMYTNYVDVVVNETDPENSPPDFLNKHYHFTIGFFILALLSKPMAVSLPFVLLILDWYPFERIQSLKAFGTALVEKLPFVVLSLGSAILTILAQKAGKAIQSIEFTPLSTRALVAIKSLVAYLSKMILPLNLIPYYPYPETASLLSYEYLLPVVLLTGITASCAVAARRQKLWLSAWTYYVITFIPVLGLVQVGGQAMADRYAYLPSLGPFLVLAIMAARIYEEVTSSERWRLPLRILSIVAATVAFISLSYVTIQQIHVWKNGLSLWNYVIEKQPASVPGAYNNLGNIYKSLGLLDKAIEQYQMALSLKPDYPDAYNNLGVAYDLKGLSDLSVPQYQMALLLEPDFAQAHNNLGNAYKIQGLLDKAMEHYQMALSLKPDYAEAHYNSAITYKAQGLLDKAIEHYQMALSLKPDYPEAYNNLGNIYKAQGLVAEAIGQYQTALRLKPDYVEAHFNLGIAYKSEGRNSEAMAEFKVALALDPGFTKARQEIESMTE